MEAFCAAKVGGANQNSSANKNFPTVPLHNFSIQYDLYAYHGVGEVLNKCTLKGKQCWVGIQIRKFRPDPDPTLSGCLVLIRKSNP
jgi:hypothetical protein